MSLLGDWFNRSFALPEERMSPDPMQSILHRQRKAVVTRAPVREEFDRWRDDPVTHFVFAALRNVATEQKRAWDELSWHGGKAEQAALAEFRTRADAYEGMETADYEGFCDWAGVEPEEEKRAE